MENIIRIRASSLPTMFDCPSRWVAINIEGLRCASSPAAALGTAIHAGTAQYDSEVLKGGQANVSDAKEAAFDSIMKPEKEVCWDENKNEVLNIAVALTEKYCKEESHKHEFLAVEVKCESLIISDLGIELTGTTDRIKKHVNGAGIVDVKSGKTAVSADGTVKTQGHGSQLGVYELLAEHAMNIPITEPAEIIGIQTNKTEKSQRIGTGKVENARLALLGDEHNTGLLTIASEISHGKMHAFGNPKSMMCNDKYCPRFNNCFWRK